MSNFQKIKDRIDVLTKFLGKTVAELEKGKEEDYPGDDERLLGNATISGWYNKSTEWTSDKLDKFLTYYNINRGWWKTGEGQIILTSVDKNGKINPEEVYRNLVESNTEYRLIPKIILDQYEIIPKRELEERAEIVRIALAAKNDVIAELKKEISDLRAKEVAMPAKQA